MQYDTYALTEAVGLGKSWPTVQSICVPKFSLLIGPGSETLADVTFVYIYISIMISFMGEARCNAYNFYITSVSITIYVVHLHQQA